MAGWMMALLLGSAVGVPGDTVWARDVVRVGELSEVLLGRVEAVEVASDGSMYLLDGLDHQIHCFAPDGQLTWRVGREGEGPGEYRSPVGLAWAPGGDLWVIDPGLQRATVLDRAGRLVETRRLPSGFVLSPWPGRFGTDGTLYHYVDATPDSYEFRMGAYDADLALGQVRTPPASPVEEQFFVGRTERGSEMRARVPYTPRFMWRLDSRGRFVSNWGAEPTFDRGGPERRTVTLPRVTPPRVTPSERRAALEALDGFTRRGGVVDLSRIPDRKPAIAFFILDDSDRIWAARSIPEGASSTVFDVLDVDGRHVGTVALPARLSAHPYPVVREGWIVGVEEGAFGTQNGVRARLPELTR